MRPGEQIASFGEEVDRELETVKKLLPEDLILRRTSDQPLQVRISGESIDELRSLAEKVKTIFRGLPGAERIRDDWGSETFSVITVGATVVGLIPLALHGGPLWEPLCYAQ